MAKLDTGGPQKAVLCTEVSEFLGHCWWSGLQNSPLVIITALDGSQEGKGEVV